MGWHSNALGSADVEPPIHPAAPNIAVSVAYRTHSSRSYTDHGGHDAQRVFHGPRASVGPYRSRRLPRRTGRLLCPKQSRSKRRGLALRGCRSAHLNERPVSGTGERCLNGRVWVAGAGAGPGLGGRAALLKKHSSRRCLQAAKMQLAAVKRGHSYPIIRHGSRRHTIRFDSIAKRKQSFRPTTYDR